MRNQIAMYLMAPLGLLLMFGVILLIGKIIGSLVMLLWSLPYKLPIIFVTACVLAFAGYLMLDVPNNKHPLL